MKTINKIIVGLGIAYSLNVGQNFITYLDDISKIEEKMKPIIKRATSFNPTQEIAGLDFCIRQGINRANKLLTSDLTSKEYTDSQYKTLIQQTKQIGQLRDAYPEYRVIKEQIENYRIQKNSLIRNIFKINFYYRRKITH